MKLWKKLTDFIDRNSGPPSNDVIEQIAIQIHEKYREDQKDYKPQMILQCNHGTIRKCFKISFL